MRSSPTLISLAWLALVPAPLAAATGQGAMQTESPNSAKFLEFAHSSTVLQGKASELAAGKDTRPEVKVFAQDMVAFRVTVQQRLEVLTRERGLRLTTVKDFEHQVVLENLEPLDYLGLSRRYIEVELQALEQEIQAFRAAGRSADPSIKGLADELLPQLEQRLDAARKVRDAVGP